MSGWLRVVGLGPGSEKWLTPEALAVLQEATDVVGYVPYVENLPASITAEKHASGNGVELERAAAALRLAAAGRRVAVVSGGDAGIFGMASAIFEAMEKGEPQWRELDVEVIPGLTALLAAAAKLGAPLGHDFCVISLSDYLKPWPVIEKRLQAASDGDFALAIYNPASKTRRDQLLQALALLRKQRSDDTIAVIAKDIGRADESVSITSLGEVDAAQVDMRTLLIIGSSHTRRVGRFIYTPRYYEDRP
ncbi:MAG: precorrin-3B C(17)-methyltransferase [Pseudomonadota bacterium]|nr:precorrin-3B C(17)-methyltransferase [Pseudomonadota bacterium]